MSDSSKVMPLEGTLERRGMLGRWKPVYITITGDQVTYSDKKEEKRGKDVFQLESLEKNSGQKGEELTFTLHFRNRKEKLVLRAAAPAEYEQWVATIEANLKLAEGDRNRSFGLGQTDPRTGLPLISVPEEFAQFFGYLNMAVIHWFGVVKKLGTGFSVEERVAILGDRCLYLCKKNADITRCVMVTEIQKLLLAQDDAKDLYVAIIMPEKVESKSVKSDSGADMTDRVEYDLMFHTPDIQTFVRYLRTVYMYQSHNKNLVLQKVRDKSQLDAEVKLVRPKGWMLVYWQPTFKEHLAEHLRRWNETRDTNSCGAMQSNQGLQSKAASGLVTYDNNATAPGSTPNSSNTQQGAGGIDDSDPLGKLLVLLELSKYYALMKEKNMNIDMLTNGLIDEGDLEHFGIDSKEDRQKIIKAAQNEELVKLTGAALSPDFLRNPPQPAESKEEFKPNLDLTDDLDLDLDVGTGGTKQANMQDIDFDDLDLDLDDFSPMAKPANNLDIDLDLGPSPPKPNNGGGIDLDLDDLDLGPPRPAVTDDLDLDLGTGAAAPVQKGGIDLDLDGL